ncbi:MFS transporter, SP family, inositol transporter [Actinopolymorpha cephalotaxi]|uniref:MFS transporter, SP family, inositol transporter n=1 Tax=Actinopolymorpha cephalotaxi TaxID=504797 RepID=A0A1I2YJX5_9ACTN|nr:MFS transporter, SP family, inositol transporter [Actinopolymorpha cephalotaxi]
MKDDETLDRRHWRWAVLASMADYIDAGSIVAGSAGLALWASAYHLSSGAVGLIAAFSSNAISAGVGCLIGGWLGDRVGRKRVYQWDLLVYAFGTLFIIFSPSLPGLLVGFVIVGLAVGADIPTSWTLIAEFSPARARGKMLGLTNVFWSLGPVLTLALAWALAPLGLLGIRIVFAHLLVVALVTWFFRRGMVESERWRNAGRQAGMRLRDFTTKANLRAFAFVFAMFLPWNLVAGTAGFFFPYILRTVGGAGQGTSVALQAMGFLVVSITTSVVFMPLSDTRHRRLLFGIGAALQAIAYGVLFTFPLGVGVAVVYLVVNNLGSGFGQGPFFRVWSTELFPTRIRASSQALLYGVVRILIGGWSFLVPVLAATGFHTLALILLCLLVISGAVGLVFMPRTAGKSLEQIQAERAPA